MGFITLSPFDLNPASELEGPGTIRLYYSNNITSEGVNVVGSTTYTDDFFDAIDWHINADNGITTSTFERLVTTVNSTDPQATVTGIIYDVNGNPQPQSLFTWHVPNSLGSTVTYEELIDYNLEWIPPPPVNSAWLDVVDSIIQSALGSRNYAASDTLGLVFLEPDPDIAAEPIAMGINNRRVSDFYNIVAYGASTAHNAATNTIAIAAAVTAANLVGAGIYVPVGTFLTNAVTINSPIMFAPGASILSITTGQTITITKAMSLDESQHFANATAGLGTVSFTGNSSIPVFYSTWWGTSGAALTAMLVARATASALTSYAGNIVSPTLIGGTSTTASLVLQSTTGVGTTGADIIAKVGNNGATEAWRTFNSGDVKIGTGTHAANVKLDVRGKLAVLNTDWVDATTGSGLIVQTGAASGNTYTQIQAYITGGSGFGDLILQPNGAKVGIANTSPAYTLDVTGTAKFSTAAIIGNTTPHGPLTILNNPSSTAAGEAGCARFSMSATGLYDGPGANDFVCLYVSAQSNAQNDTHGVWAFNPIVDFGNRGGGGVTSGGFTMEVDINAWVADAPDPHNPGQQTAVEIAAGGLFHNSAAIATVTTGDDTRFKHGLWFDFIGGLTTSTLIKAGTHVNVEYGVDLKENDSGQVHVTKSAFRAGYVDANVVATAVLGQFANNGIALHLQRFTDSTPTGYFISAANAANNVGLFSVDTSGSVLAAGNVTGVNLITSGIVQMGAVRFGASGPTWTSGTGSPEGVVSAPRGSVYSRTDGGAGTSLYQKVSGTGTTLWTAIA